MGNFYRSLCYITVPPSLTTFSLPTPGESVFARCLSSLQTERVSASNELKGPATTKYTGDKKEFIEHIRKVMLGKMVKSVYEPLEWLIKALNNWITACHWDKQLFAQAITQWATVVIMKSYLPSKKVYLQCFWVLLIRPVSVVWSDSGYFYSPLDGMLVHHRGSYRGVSGMVHEPKNRGSRFTDKKL